MSTITASQTRWYIPTTGAEKAYASMTAVLAVGFAGIAAYAGVPGMHWGMAIVLLAAVALGIGGVLEKDTITVIGAFFGGITAHMVVVTSATDRAYSHKTLAAMFLSVVAVLLAAARFSHIRKARSGR